MVGGQATIEERQLLKTMRWWDGFLVALANPGFLIATFGFSVGVLGPWGSVLVWSVSALFGGLQAWIYQEPAAMFPDKAGGIALYAYEGWKRYFSLVGPLATFGYWFAWSGVLAIFSFTIGGLVHDTYFPGITWEISLFGGFSHFNFAKVVAVACIGLVWVFNWRGMRPAVWVSYVTSALLCIPLFVVMFAFLSGSFTWPKGMSFTHTVDGAQVTETPGVAVILVWLYLAAWSSYATETCATFAPEYHDTVNDTALALKTSSVFDVAVFFLLPLGVVGTLTVDQVAEGATGGYLVEAMKAVVGAGSAKVLLLFVIAGLLLSMNTATMDGSRALYGISKDDMTVRWLGKLNHHHVPANAMAVDAVLNIFLVVVFDSTLFIFAGSNLGYVFAHIAALTGFLLLRKDRPDAFRPIRLSAIWTPIAWLLAAGNGVLLLVGLFQFDLTGYGSGHKILGIDRYLWIGVLILASSIVLFLYRRLVQDRAKFTWRERDEVTVGGA